ncbi:MAG: flavodoxin-dependent (E)-4-hydroxy-3-methylbut-2-enyl-diphosphate synthase [Clostridia bacterium]|nr:flavodoxin-dependent (E)-4-hydroxy-3-methylbut-2-enyl-diphosphate synthase [Clostridia bacterium]
MDFVKRRETNRIKLGRVQIGGGAPISIQSMTNTDTYDKEATYRQVLALEEAGCDIVRITVPHADAAPIFGELKKRGVGIPLVADIHFSHEAAIASVLAGADKIRINPGNIGSGDKVAAVAEVCAAHGVPIRIGVNSGSVEKSILEKHGAPTAEALVESALYHASLLEELDFHDIAVSVKASDVPTMIAANRLLAEKTSYPIHLGVTEAGARDSALVKSSIGIGTLLSEGIGDTVRVSLTDDPIKEVSAAREILKALKLTADGGIEIVGCPTCGRTKINLIKLLSEFEDRIKAEGLDRLSLKVALMGCVVNGPGEAREADIGIAGGVGEGLLFKKGVPVRKIKEDRLIDELIDEIKKMRSEQ